MFRPDTVGERLRDWLAGSETALVALALAIGVGAGAGAVGFRELIFGFTELFTGYRDYSATAHTGNPHLPLGVWFVVLVPVVGGLIYGPVVARFAPEARGHGVPEVMLAVARQGGRIRPQVPFVKAMASALCIGTGGSVGREGPIVQISSAIGSVIGRLGRVDEQRLRLLVACGAAGGISATFNAPIAGVFFALEVILRSFEARSFGIVVLSSVVADAIGRAVFGQHAFLALPAFHLASPVEYLLYLVLGVLAALVGVAFIKVLYGGEDLADRLWAWLRAPEWLRPGAGGVLLGLLLLGVPEMYGVGYPVLEGAIGGHYGAGLLVGFLFAKVLATSLTIAIGGSGGVFAPSLFMGSMLGSAFGAGVHGLLPGITAPAGAYGLVGMGAVFAASARAPITAVLIVFELTGDYSIILPLMFAVVLATGVSHRLVGERTIYTTKLFQRGIDVTRPRRTTIMDSVPVARAMRPVPAALAPDASVADAVERLAQRGGGGVLPVVGGDGALEGVVSTADLGQTIGDQDPDAPIDRLLHTAQELHADQTLSEAVAALSRTDDPGLPVLAPDGGRAVVGWITHRDVLRAYQGALDVAARA